jgi:hypothetical protein
MPGHKVVLVQPGSMPLSYGGAVPSCLKGGSDLVIAGRKVQRAVG